MGTTERYTHGHDDSVLRSHRWRTAANSAAYLLDRLRPGQRLLDVGAGPGTITIDLARIVAPGPVLGVDRAESVLADARRAAAASGLSNVEFGTGDAYALDLPDDAFDVVHAHQVLQHLADPVAALREFRRVCVPGGTVAARDGDYAAMTWYPQVPGLADWLTLYRTMARANGGEPDAGRRLVSWASAAGFTDVTASASVWCFATPPDREWWAGTWAERITTSSLAEQMIGAGLATRAELDRLAAAWRAWAAAPDGWFAVLHGEILCRA